MDVSLYVPSEDVINTLSQVQMYFQFSNLLNELHAMVKGTGPEKSSVWHSSYPYHQKSVLAEAA